MKLVLMNVYLSSLCEDSIMILFYSGMSFWIIFSQKKWTSPLLSLLFCTFISLHFSLFDPCMCVPRPSLTSIVHVAGWYKLIWSRFWVIMALDRVEYESSCQLISFWVWKSMSWQMSRTCEVNARLV